MQCAVTITRKRVTTRSTEESAISFVLLSEDLVESLETMTIDEKRKHVLTRISKTKRGSETKESDHNIIETKLKIPWNKKTKPKLEALFNLKNSECQKLFNTETSKNNKLSKIFDEIKDLDKATEKFMSCFNKVLHKCFRKIGHKNKSENIHQENLYNL